MASEELHLPPAELVLVQSDANILGAAAPALLGTTRHCCGALGCRSGGAERWAPPAAASTSLENIQRPLTLRRSASKRKKPPEQNRCQWCRRFKTKAVSESKSSFELHVLRLGQQWIGSLRGRKVILDFWDQKPVFQISTNCHFSMFQEHRGPQLLFL